RVHFVLSLLHWRPSHPVPPSFPTRRSSDLPHLLRRLQSRLSRSAERNGGTAHAGRHSHHREFLVFSMGRRRSTRPSPTDHRSFGDRKSTRLNSSHVKISYAVFCLKKKNYNV